MLGLQTPIETMSLPKAKAVKGKSVKRDSAE